MIKTTVNTVLFAGDSPVEFFVNIPVACIKAAIADHLIMLFRDMPYEPLDEVHNRDGFLDIFVIFVSVIVEGNKVAIIAVDPGGGDYGPSKVTSNVFENGFRMAFVRFGIDIETVFVLLVTAGFGFFEGGTDNSGAVHQW